MAWQIVSWGKDIPRSNFKSHVGAFSCPHCDKNLDYIFVQKLTKHFVGVSLNDIPVLPKKNGLDQDVFRTFMSICTEIKIVVRCPGCLIECWKHTYADFLYYAFIQTNKWPESGWVKVN